MKIYKIRKYVPFFDSDHCIIRVLLKAYDKLQKSTLLILDKES